MKKGTKSNKQRNKNNNKHKITQENKEDTSIKVLLINNGQFKQL